MTGKKFCKFFLCVCVLLSISSFAAQTSVGLWSMDYMAPYSTPSMDSEGKFHKVYPLGETPETQQLWYRESEYLLTEWTMPTLALETMADQTGNMFLGANGRYHCTYRHHSGNNYQFYYINSDDGGQTWTNPVGVSESTNEALNCHYQTRGSHIYFLWDDNRSGMGGGWSYSPVAYFRCSYDNGDTWEPEVRLSPAGGWAPRIVVDSKGTLHANWQDSKDGAAEQYYGYSLDQGKTWSEEIRVTEDDDTVSELSNMAVGPDDRIHLFWLDQRPPNSSTNIAIYHSMSVEPGYNGADVWTTPQKISDFSPIITGSSKNNTKGLIVHYGAPTCCVREGIMHLLWANYHEIENPGEPKKDISYIYWTYSRDGGETWSSINCIDNINSNSAAPAAVLYDNTLALFWRDDRTGIAQPFVKFLDKRKTWPHEGGTLSHTRYFDGPCTTTQTGFFWPRANVPAANFCLTEDINRDGLVDLLTLDSNRLVVYKESGEIIWEADPATDAGLTDYNTQLVPMMDITDIDGDTCPEVIVSIRDSSQGENAATSGTLVVYSKDGTPVQVINSEKVCSLYPTNCFDIDDDTRAEIICGVESEVTSGGLIVFNGEDGSLVKFIPQDNMLFPKVLSDINNDGNPEIVCTQQGKDKAFARAFSDALVPLWSCDLGAKGDVILSDMPTGSPPVNILVTGTFNDDPGDNLTLALCNGSTGIVEEFTTPVLYTTLIGEISTADIDSDNEIEILCTGKTNQIVRLSLSTLEQELISTETLTLRCLGDVTGNGEINAIGNRGGSVVLFDHTLNPFQTINLNKEIKNIFISDFNTDNINDLVIQTSDNVEIWSWITIEDVYNKIKNHLLGSEPLKDFQVPFADFNEDDVINIADLIKIIWMLE